MANYKRVLNRKQVHKSRKCMRPQCVGYANDHVNLICNNPDCRQSIEKTNPWHLANVFGFAFIAILSVGLNWSWNSFSIPWILFLWSIFWVGIYLYIILKYDENKWFAVGIMLISALVFIAFTYDGFKQLPYASLWPIILLVIIFLSLTVIFLKSCLDFGKANDLHWLKKLAIIGMLGTLDLFIFSFVFNIPAKVIVNLRDSITNYKSTSMLSSTAIAAVANFLEYIFLIRVGLLFLWIFLIFLFYVVVETFKDQSILDVARDVKNIIRSLLITTKESFKPLWQIFWYVNENVLLIGVLPIIVCLLILTALFKIFGLSHKLAIANSLDIISSLAVIALVCALYLLIPVFVLTIGRFHIAYWVPLASNILVANNRLVLLVALTIGSTSIFLSGLLCVLSWKNGLSLPSLYHSFWIPLFIGVTAYLLSSAKTRSLRW